MTPELKARIQQCKRDFKEAGVNPALAFEKARDHLLRDIERIMERRLALKPVIPEIYLQTIAKGEVPDVVRQTIRRFGIVIIRNVFSNQEALDWSGRLLDYVNTNQYQKSIAMRQNYFKGSFADQEVAKVEYPDEVEQVAIKPTLDHHFSIFWSKPQIEIRQHQNLMRTKAFLNSLWVQEPNVTPEFNPNFETCYAQDFMLRGPRDKSAYYPLHIKGSAVERWVDPAYRNIYAKLFAGDIQGFDPWRAHMRTKIRDIPSFDKSSVFKSFYGSMTLSRVSPGEGAHQCIPLSRAIAYVLLRSLQDDIPEDRFIGASTEKNLMVTSSYFKELTDATIPIPEIQPGDTIWWHPDLIWGTESLNRNQDAVITLPLSSAPLCSKNNKYLSKQWEAFTTGRSPPDYISNNVETYFANRAEIGDLTDLGIKIMTPTSS